MKNLNGADRYQLYIESATHHQHTLKVLLLDPAPLRQPLTLERLRQWAGTTLAQCPPLRWQLAALPAGRPVWVDSPDFDLDYHVNREVVAAPGGREELASLLARLQETKLDRARPLWRLWLVEGLADGQIALVWSLHHSLSDGGGTVTLFDQIFDHGPDDRPADPVRSPSIETAPDSWTLFVAGLRGFLVRLAHLPVLVTRSLRAVHVARTWRRAQVVGPARPFEAPVTPFGHTITSHRTSATASVPFDEIVALRQGTGATVNDVFLAMTGGALLSYLADHGRIPRRSLTAGMPVSIRGPEQAGSFGNFLSTWFLQLATDEPDPLARLRAITRATRTVRALATERRSEQLQSDWMEHTLLFKAYVGFGNLTTRRIGRPPFNVIVSSVKGPATLWFDGAPVTEIQSYSQLAAGVGLNITAWTYNGKMTIGLVACPEHVSDLSALADRMAPALAELTAAARQTTRVA